MRWFFVNDPLNQIISRHPSQVALNLIDNSQTQAEAEKSDEPREGEQIEI